MGIIDKDAGPRRRLTAGSASAAFLLVALSSVFYGVMHFIHDEGAIHPAVVMFLPVAGVCWIASVIPLLIYLTYPEDFRTLNPLHPVHYVHIARKAYRAMSNNNFKVTEKDL